MMSFRPEGGAAGPCGTDVVVELSEEGLGGIGGSVDSGPSFWRGAPPSRRASLPP